MTRSKLSALAASTLAVLALALAVAPEADAGWLRHRARRRCVPLACQQARYAAPAAYPAPMAYPTPQAVTATTRAQYSGSEYYAAPATGDPHGFVAWINGVRSRHGLRPVAWDPSLVPYAAANSSRGLGHWPGTNTGYQNVGAGGSLATIQAMWLQSPPHAAAILAPGMSRVGVAQVNGVFTMNGR